VFIDDYDIVTQQKWSRTEDKQRDVDECPNNALTHDCYTAAIPRQDCLSLGLHLPTYDFKVHAITVRGVTLDPTLQML